MDQKTKSGRSAGETLGDLIISFGVAMGDVLEDPKVKEKARELSQVIIDAAAKSWGDRVKDDKAKDRVRTMGKVAQDFGKSLEEHFEPDQAHAAPAPEPTGPAA